MNMRAASRNSMPVVGCFLTMIMLELGVKCSDAEVRTLPDAVRILRDTPPLVSPTYISANQVQQMAADQIYAQQVEAINLVAESKSLALAPLLIPFLNYPVKGFSPFHVGHPGPERSLPKQTLEDLCRHWPAINALFEIPGSSQVLMDYDLNSKNPVNSRIAVFDILRYFDLHKFGVVEVKLDREFASSGPNFKNLLGAIEAGSFRYCGIEFFDQFDN